MASCPHLCQIVDTGDFSVVSPEAWHVYVVSEAYNSSLMDLYRTKKAENVDFSEDQLVEVCYQVLQGLSTLNRRGGVHLKGMLRMDQIHFDEQGTVKLQEMSHIHFDQYRLSSMDLIFQSPEALAYGKLSAKADVWTLGIILLLCISLEFDLDAFSCKVAYSSNLCQRTKMLSLRSSRPCSRPKLRRYCRFRIRRSRASPTTARSRKLTSRAANPRTLMTALSALAMIRSGSTDATTGSTFTNPPTRRTLRSSSAAG